MIFKKIVSNRNKKLLNLHKNKRFCEDINGDLNKRFDISNYEIEGPLTRDNNKKVFGLMKDVLDRKIMTNFVAFRPKTCTHSNATVN